MTITPGYFETDDGPQIAFATGLDADGRHETVAVLSETNSGDLVSGQTAFKHKVENGTDPGQFHT